MIINKDLIVPDCSVSRKSGHNCLVWTFEYSLHPIAGAQKIYARASYL